MKEPINPNYCATVVEISNIIPLEKCDNVVGTMIFGCHVIVGKDTKVGDVGLYFPVETALSPEFLKENNLFREPTLNKDTTKKGYFEEHGRIKCVRFRGFPSDGFFIPLNGFVTAYGNAKFKVGDAFDEINGVKICEKYVSRSNPAPLASPSGKVGFRVKEENRMVDGQFNLHKDTSHLAKNLHKIQPYDYISVTNKMHGANAVFGKVLTKRKLNLLEKLLKKLGVKIQETEYSFVFGSRERIRNARHNVKIDPLDLWGANALKVQDTIPNGFTLYGELVGFYPQGKAVQKSFDYGCEPGKSEFYVFRITFTNDKGQVFELSWPQVKEFCVGRGLKYTKEFFYGTAGFLALRSWDSLNSDMAPFYEAVLKQAGSFNLEGMCDLCKNKVPREGVVVRVDKLDKFEAFKLKSFAFKNFESKAIDKGEVGEEN